VDVDAVVFDLGGVLIDWDPRHLYCTVFATDEALEYFLGSVCSLEWHFQHDRGAPMSQTVPDLAARFPEYHDEIMRWTEQDAMIRGALDEVVELLRRLRTRSVRCFALTNWPAESFDRARERFPFLGWFDGIVISGEERIAKPEPAIFRRLLDRYGLDAQSTLFVDNSRENIDAAQTLGFQTHLFHTAGALAADLARRGLLPA